MKALVLQDIILNTVRREKTKIIITASNGSKYFGIIRGFDNYTIILDIEDGRQLMIYKYNIISVEGFNAVLTDNFKESYE